VAVAEERKRGATPKATRMPTKRNASSRSKETKATTQRRSTTKGAEAATPGPPPAPPTSSSAAPAASWRLSFGRTLVGVIVVAGFAAAIVGALSLRDHGTSFEPNVGVPTEASASELRAYSKPSRPVYWAGAPQDEKMEVTRNARAVYVRYLKPGAEIGDKTAGYTTIATYPVKGALSMLQRSARTAGAVSFRAPRGATALWRKSRATSVYLAWPHANYLVEIYDPSPTRARALAQSGTIRRVP
jgi:hypothetical protein